MAATPSLADVSSYFPQLELPNNPKKQATIENICRPLVLSAHKIQKIYDVFEQEIQYGLAKSPPRASSLQMENTYLPALPDGKEKGEYLALDLGGTNFRVLHLDLNKPIEDEDNFHVKYYSVPEAIRLGPGDKLFEFLADCIYDFMENKNLLGKRLPLGFCFSFPMKQQALNSGILLTWTKSFNCPGVTGKDCVQMLKDAIDQRGGMDVDIVAVVNDSTGTLVKGAFLDHNCFIGMILGTGCNACYMEDIKNIENWEGSKEGIEEVVIDIEWGAFGDNGVLNFMKSEFDRCLDDNSLLVNSFTFEKMFAGKYLGELCRYVFVKLIREKMLFDGRASETLLTFGSFTTADVSKIEQQNSDDAVREIAKRLGYVNIDEDDIKVMRYVCAVCSTRGALLVSICLANLLNRMKRPKCTIAIDGSLYKYHPHFHNLMTCFITILAPGRPFQLLLAEDGSGKGAALVAAVAHRLRTTGYSKHGRRLSRYQNPGIAPTGDVPPVEEEEEQPPKCSDGSFLQVPNGVLH